MRTAGALLYACFVVAVFASCLDRAQPLWLVLACLVVVLFVAALTRIHAVVNAPRSPE
ncbi:hypothetical protein [Curtobacterium sp. DN_7.5]|uniref:hypothetical protein n=1 Tax=Curtobacterium sp. DN_7.5 TaxID=3049047 RepID=UPI001F5A0C3C|nr:hypothetical protein [Curtobacterium sp. DN_7.5]